MLTPDNIKQVHLFIGAVTYYCDMWPCRLHILAPLTNLTGKDTFHWTPTHQKAFDTIKALMVEDVLLCYPDHNLPFHICTDASDYQLGAVILQQNVPVAFYSRKLSKTQQNYTTIEKELLSVVETFRTFCSMLLGVEIHVYTNQKNLTYNTLSTQCVLQWRLFIEDFHPTFHYNKGVDNVMANALSHLQKIDDSITTLELILSKVSCDTTETFSIEFDNNTLLESLINYPNYQMKLFSHWNIP